MKLLIRMTYNLSSWNLIPVERNACGKLYCVVKRDPLVFVGDSNGCALVVISKHQLMTAVEAPLRHAR